MFGRPEIGVQLGNYIIARDPLCQDCYANLAENYMGMGRNKEAEERLRQALALYPSIWATNLLGQALLLDGRPEEALEVFEALEERLTAETGEDYEGFPGHLETLHALGLTEQFDALLPKFLEYHAANGHDLLIAQHYAWMGDKDKAFEWLDRHDREMTWGIRDHLTRPWYRKLHDDPRWQALLEEYQMTASDFEAIDLTIRMPPDAHRYETVAKAGTARY
jgi:tetratricopeptide (TPR) repeat protein